MSNDFSSLAPVKKKRLKRAVLWVLVFFLLLFAAAAAGGSYLWKTAVHPADASSTQEMDVSIPLGSSLSSIAQTLEDEGIIENAMLFKYYVKYKGEGNFQAGDYLLSPSMSSNEIIQALKEGKIIEQADGKLMIPEGFQLTQIAEVIAAETDQDAEDVLAVLNSREFIKQMMEKHPALVTESVLNEQIRYPLEGYLYPATYEITDSSKPVAEIAEEMIAKTEEVVLGYAPQIKAANMTIHEFLTFASLVEEEATSKTDRKKIASVFYNRIEEGMPLQTDPTVLYAKGAHQERVFYKDLEVESPYNTYQVKGLTPGPIGNSGADSMEAVLAPEKTDYLYFLASPAGDVYFSKTLEEHNRLKAEHITGS